MKTYNMAGAMPGPRDSMMNPSCALRESREGMLSHRAGVVFTRDKGEP